MHSKHFLNFGIPDVDHEFEVARDPRGEPRLFFRHPGNPLVGLDLGDMKRLETLMEQDGDANGVAEMRRYFDQANALGFGPPGNASLPRKSAEPSPLKDGFQTQVYPNPRSGR